MMMSVEEVGKVDKFKYLRFNLKKNCGYKEDMKYRIISSGVLCVKMDFN